MAKRTLDSFFKPPEPKRPRLAESTEAPSNHSTYAFAIPQLPASLAASLDFSPAAEAENINDKPDLDLQYYKPYIAKDSALDLFQFFRDKLFFYRVQYKIKRGTVETAVSTPRYTTVFGVDETSRFSDDGIIIDAKTLLPLPASSYRCKPRPLPGCLDRLRRLTEGSTGESFNFCLVNYYAGGNDSISYHSDDERFLGSNPVIASLSLGTTRDFLMKHKPVQGQQLLEKEAPAVIFALGSGDMILMRGHTQANWLHSVPKRKTTSAAAGRINITFRKALVKAGTENYYTYNVGVGPAFRWDESKREMVPYNADTAHASR
jgi:hypothetical protein